MISDAPAGAPASAGYPPDTPGREPHARGIAQASSGATVVDDGSPQGATDPGGVIAPEPAAGQCATAHSDAARCPDAAARATVASIVLSSAAHRAALAAVAAEAPPHAAIGAGFVRALVWDILAGRSGDLPPDESDIDVVYYDPAECAAARDAAAEQRLARALPGPIWQVRNQARVHLGRRDRPFRSLEDALAHWPETATAIAVRLRADGGLDVIAPHGVADLLALVVRPVPGLEAACRERWRAKRWHERWPVRFADAG